MVIYSVHVLVISYVCVFVDLYQITMAYAYWKSGKTTDMAIFDLYFRRNPFKGEFTIFAGLEECLKFIQNFQYSDQGTFFKYLIKKIQIYV